MGQSEVGMVRTLPCDLDFYRAMRMHNTDYAAARCLSVRPFVTRRYCVETAKRVIELFSHRLVTQFSKKQHRVVKSQLNAFILAQQFKKQLPVWL